MYSSPPQNGERERTESNLPKLGLNPQCLCFKIRNTQMVEGGKIVLIPLDNANHVQISRVNFKQRVDRI